MLAVLPAATSSAPAQAEQSAVTRTGHIRSFDGTKLFYRRAGSGSTVVILPNDVFLGSAFGALAQHFTIVSYDMRARGQSERPSTPSGLIGGIENDVKDLEAIRSQLQLGRVSLIGHSYLGFVVALYARLHPQSVARVIQIGPMQPRVGETYPPEQQELSLPSPGFREEVAQATQHALSDSAPGEDLCRAWWSVARKQFVWDQSKVEQLDDGFCAFPNEWPKAMSEYLAQYIRPSAARLSMQPSEVASIDMPVLVIHGERDRNAPIGAGIKWINELPHARLLRIPDAGHVPWVERPDIVFTAIRTFLDGSWPADARGREDRGDR